MKVMQPTRYQRAILSVPEQYNILLAGGRGGGKALDLNTPIPTPSGWKLLKDILVGDTVFDEHGVPCQVTATFERMPEKAYRLHFSDGTALDACDEHQWVTWTHFERKRYLRADKTPAKGLPEDWANAPSRTTQDIVDTLTFGKRSDSNHCIPTAGPLQLKEATLPVDPYLLGLWLGDGTSNTGGITTMDPEVVASFTKAGFELRELGGCSNGRAKTYIVGPSFIRKGMPKGSCGSVWTQSLWDLDVLKNKHVPAVYLRASAEQRLSLLQGLMDSDGHASSDKKRVEFCNTNKLLIDAVLELARSLGEKPVVKHGRAMLKGVDCGDKWRVTWRAKAPCFRLPRKLSRIQGACAQESRHLHRMIVKAELIAPVPMRCLTVDSPNHMYLAGEGMIPTHNSVAIMFLMLRHADTYREMAYALFVRESYEAIKQLEEEFELLVMQLYGPNTVKHHKTEHTFTFPHGAKIQFGQLKDQQDYVKYQGKSYTLLVVDEYGEISNPRWVTLLMSNIRGPKGMPLRTVFAANPGGAQHGYLHGGFIACSTAWAPFTREDGETWVVCPSTWRDNPNIDHEKYLIKLRAACGNDEDLFKAWDTGDWDIARGAYFAGALDSNIHKVKSLIFPIQKLHRIFQPFIAMDWGSGAPGVAYICAESPGIVGYPKGSLILCDEIASYDQSDQGNNTGLNWSPSKWADALHEKCKEWDCPPEGVCDEAYGIEETLLEKFGELGLSLIKPKKERIAGWQMMRNMLVSVKKRDGKSGLWISDRCEYFWKTAPFITRDPKRPEDLNTKEADHGVDAARYGCLHLGRYAYSGSTSGHY